MKRLFLIIVSVVAMFNVACDKQSGDDYKVVISSDAEIKVGMYSEDVTIHYDILGIEDVNADVALSDDSWLRVSKHESGTLVITVADNETGASRMAAVTLSYGGSSASAIISQSGEATMPIITSKSGEEMTIERCGTKVRIEYQLQYPNPTDYIYAKTSADWIYSINTEGDGYVELGVGTNTSNALRETIVTVGYGKASFDIALKQRGDGDINFMATTLTGAYLGDALTPGVGNYWFILSDRGFDAEGKSLPNATYYRIDAYSVPYHSADDMIPIANGTYTFDNENTLATGTFTAEYSGHWVTNSQGQRDDILPFESGTLVVADNKITLDVVVDGQKHHVEYTGSTLIKDERGSIRVYSTLEGDYEADLSDHSMVYECYGDYYEFGYTNWMFVITPNDGEGDCFQFDIITDKRSADEGFLGEYQASEFLAKNSFIPGWIAHPYLQCSWYFTVDQTEIAPFRGGTMSVKDNGDGTVTVEIDVTDDLRNRITGTWRGTPMKAN